MSEEGDCKICYSAITEEEKSALSVTRLSCGDTYHAHCIGRWFQQGHRSCPLCFQLYLDEPAAAAEATVPLLERFFHSVLLCLFISALFFGVLARASFAFGPEHANETMDDLFHGTRRPLALFESNFSLSRLRFWGEPPPPEELEPDWMFLYWAQHFGVLADLLQCLFIAISNLLHWVTSIVFVVLCVVSHFLCAVLYFVKVVYQGCFS